MTRFIERHPAWALILLIAVAVMLWLILAVWPPGLEEAIGRKRVFLNAVFNGITLGSLYFLVASGFTLIFGLMRNVNLAHGSLYLFGGYIGYAISVWTGSWVLGFIIAFLGVALVFGFVNTFIRPVAKVLTFPLIVITLGIFALVVNGLMLWLTSALSASLDLGFHVSGFWAAFFGALVVSIISMLLWMMVRQQPTRTVRF